MKKNLLTILLLTLGFSLLLTWIGWTLGQAFYEPKEIVKIKTITLPAPPPEIIIEEKKVEVQIIKEVPRKLRYFTSTDELEVFLEESLVDHTIYSRGGVIVFNTYDCEDYAIALRNEANDKGYYMNIQMVRNYKRPDTGEYLVFHALNSIIIGNEIYYIEPQTDGYWFDSFLDDPRLVQIDGDEPPDPIAVYTGGKPLKSYWLS